MRRVAALIVVLSLTTASHAAEDFAILDGHGGPVKHIAVSPDGALAATAGFDYSAGLWDIAGASHLRWLDGHEAAVNTAAFSPDGQRLVTGGDDFTLIVW